MRTLFIILFVGNVLLASAQEFSSDELFKYKNSVQLEGGGGCFLYSINYERLIIYSTKFNTAIQSGVSLLGNSNNLTSFFRVDITEIFGSRNLRFELGIGLSNYYESSRSVSFGNPDGSQFWSTFVAFRAGVRYQKPEDRFLFRVAYTPLYGTSDDVVGLMHWGGISVGYAF